MNSYLGYVAIVASCFHACMMIKEFNEPLISEIIIGVARRSMRKAVQGTFVDDD